MTRFDNTSFSCPYQLYFEITNGAENLEIDLDDESNFFTLFTIDNSKVGTYDTIEIRAYLVSEWQESLYYQ